ncbi:MAG TPA: autotransporter outer membrane beta-barrel domain-containing protein, partial [Alphaproteobacteria bacterium]|nr:autotransporter outer membrane beta-barrel domain-containing protein [Alphaproteobacteria bacterium]
SKQLTVGLNDLSTQVDGVIADGGAAGGAGGSLIKVGLGTLTLNGDDTYSGGTTVSGGTIIVGDLSHPSAALSGGGPVYVAQGATFGGYGSVTGSVTNDGTVVAGNATPGFSGMPIGTFTIIGTLLNRGTVNLASDPIVGNILLVQGSYVGASGMLNLNTVLGSDNSPSDKLVISGGTGTGNTSVHINNAGGLGAITQANGIPVVQAINGATTATGAFALAGEARGGDIDYELFQGGLNGSDPNDWFLRSSIMVPPIPPEPPEPGPLPPDPPPDPLPPGVYPIIGPELATYGVVQPIARQLGLTVLGTLHERIGDTLTLANTGSPANDGTDFGGSGRSAWGRFFGQQIENHYQAFANPSADGRLVGFQLGYDLFRGDLIADHRDVAGAYFAYGNSNMGVNGLVTNAAANSYVQSHTGSVALNSYSGGLYWTHYGPGDWYLDGVLQGTHYTGNATTEFANLPTVGNGFAVSLEAGYPVPLPLGPHFVLEPQAQIIWQHVGFQQGNDGLGEVALGTTSGATGRLGVRGQWTIEDEDGQVWQPYARANVWRDWDARATTTFSGVDQVPLDEQATRLEFAGGLTVKLNTSFSLYAQAGYQFAISPSDARRDGVKGDIGVRYTW